MKPIDALKARVQWRCRRGMYELDLLISPYMAYHKAKLTEQELRLWEALLCYPDEQLYRWFYCEEPPPTDALNQLVQAILRHAKAINRGSIN